MSRAKEHPDAWMARAHEDRGASPRRPHGLRRRGPADAHGTAPAGRDARGALDPGRRLPRVRAATAAPEPLLPVAARRVRRGRGLGTRDGGHRSRPRGRGGPDADRRGGARRSHERLPLAGLPLHAAHTDAARRRAVRDRGQRAVQRGPRAAGRGHRRRRSGGARGAGGALRQLRERGLAATAGRTAAGNTRDAARAGGHERSRRGDASGSRPRTALAWSST